MLFSLEFAQEYTFIILLFSQMGQKEQTHYDFQHFICWKFIYLLVLKKQWK